MRKLGRKRIRIRVKSTNFKGKKGERYNVKAEVKSITKKG